MRRKRKENKISMLESILADLISFRLEFKTISESNIVDSEIIRLKAELNQLVSLKNKNSAIVLR